MTPILRSKKFTTLGLALALSCGTVGGLLGAAALATGPALAQSAGNGGGGGAGGAGEFGNVMNAAITHARQPNRPRNPPVVLTTRPRVDCGTQRDGSDVRDCKYTERRAPRVVQIYGHAQCAVVQQVPGTDGKPPEFYCLRRL